MNKTLLYTLLTVVFNALCLWLASALHVNAIAYIPFFGALIAGMIITSFSKKEELKPVGPGLLWGTLATFVLAVGTVVYVLFAMSGTTC